MGGALKQAHTILIAEWNIKVRRGEDYCKSAWSANIENVARSSAINYDLKLCHTCHTRIKLCHTRKIIIMFTINVSPVTQSPLNKNIAVKS